MTLATRFMPGLLSGFSQSNPGISVKLVEGDQQEMIDSLLSGRIEMALSYAFAVPEEIVGDQLAELPPYVVISGEHRLAGRKEVSLAELSEEPFLLLDLPHSRDYFLGLFARCQVEPRIAFRSRSFELIRGLIEHQRGYSIHNAVPRTTIGYDGSRIAVLRIAEPLPPTHITLMRLRRHELRPAVKAFADFVTAAFAVGGLYQPGSIAPPGVDAA
jgi:DNA-binding transcriptional LysR family regulator